MHIQRHSTSKFKDPGHCPTTAPLNSGTKSATKPQKHGALAKREPHCQRASQGPRVPTFSNGPAVQMPSTLVAGIMAKFEVTISLVETTRCLGTSPTLLFAKIRGIEGMALMETPHCASFLKVASTAHAGTKPTASKMGDTSPDASTQGDCFPDLIKHHE